MKYKSINNKKSSPAITTLEKCNFNVCVKLYSNFITRPNCNEKKSVSVTALLVLFSVEILRKK